MKLTSILGVPSILERALVIVISVYSRHTKAQIPGIPTRIPWCSEPYEHTPYPAPTFQERSSGQQGCPMPTYDTGDLRGVFRAPIVSLYQPQFSSPPGIPSDVQVGPHEPI